MKTKTIFVVPLLGVRTGVPWIIANQPTTCVSNRDQLGIFYCDTRKPIYEPYKV